MFFLYLYITGRFLLVDIDFRCLYIDVAAAPEIDFLRGVRGVRGSAARSIVQEAREDRAAHPGLTVPATKRAMDSFTSSIIRLLSLRLCTSSTVSLTKYMYLQPGPTSGLGSGRIQGRMFGKSPEAFQRENLMPFDLR